MLFRTFEAAIELSEYGGMTVNPTTLSDPLAGMVRCWGAVAISIRRLPKRTFERRWAKYCLFG